MLKSKDISVVVQGAIDTQNTPLCLKSIRKVLPEATIILSTWRNSNVKSLDFDILIENDDPGAEVCDNFYNIKNNINRQIVSTKNGLKSVKTKFAMKLRSDMIIANKNFISNFAKYDDYRNDNCKLFKNRIIINNLYCADPELTQFPFHMSDWVQFGLTDDLLNLWDIEIQKEPDMSRYFLDKQKPQNDKNKTWLFKYIPEQYIAISCLKKNNIEFNCSWYSDLTAENLNLTKLFFANNFLILDYEKYGVKFLKFNPYKWDYSKQLNFDKWQDYFIEFCNNEYKKPLLDRFITKLKIKEDLKKIRKHKIRMIEGIENFVSNFISLIFYTVKIIIKFCIGII